MSQDVTEDGTLRSAAFDGIVGLTVPATGLAARDREIDRSRFSSQGCWAFCRFDDEEIPAIRLGFQLGGFNLGPESRGPDANQLQLHLEVMTRDGALLWLPSGVYPAASVLSRPGSMDVRLDVGGREIFQFLGWPRIACHVRSEDGDLETDLRFDLENVTILPDAVLPQCVFAMWESIGHARGSVTFRGRTVAVNGSVFFDQPRVVERRHDVTPRQMYLYTTLRLEDGAGLFGYYAQDVTGRPIADYRFCVFVDAVGRGRLLSDGVLERLQLDEDDIARAWRLRWRDATLELTVEVEVRPGPILRSWGAPDAPQTRREFGFPPLVLDAQVRIERRGMVAVVRGSGLAEHYNASPDPGDILRRIEQDSAAGAAG